MEALYIMIPLTLLLSGGLLTGVIWSIRQGQLDDLDTPALRMLIDDEQKGNTRE